MPATNNINPLFIILLYLAATACEPEWVEPYEVFTIPKGEHARSFPLEMLQTDALEFEAVFDHSAMYTTKTPENQWDTNKLLGFADCNNHHHTNSARFGWRWLEGELEISAYCYVEGERVIEKIAVVDLNTTHHYSLQITENHYLFKVDDLPGVSIQRKVDCDVGTYYMLFPYFGGDEVAPHDINIKIKRFY